MQTARKEDRMKTYGAFLAVNLVMALGLTTPAPAAQPTDVVTSDASQNTAMGSAALSVLTTGAYNTASGDKALQNNTTGSTNTANGDGALYLNSIGISNT